MQQKLNFNLKYGPNLNMALLLARDEEYPNLSLVTSTLTSAHI
jgi:hypothetical protein